MIVVADSSPLNYLIQMQSDSLLQQLYGHVFVPNAVIEELRHPRAPVAVASWLQNIPSWLEVIFLAEEMRANLLLIDEKQGRLAARRRSISTIGDARRVARGWKEQLGRSRVLISASYRGNIISGFASGSGTLSFILQRVGEVVSIPFGDQSRLTDHMKTCAADCTIALTFSSKA